MKVFYCLFMILFFSKIVIAQSKEREEPRKIIKLPKYSIGDFPKHSIDISEIQIQQAVWDSVRIGYVQKGPDQHIAELRPDKPLTAFLQEHFNRLYKDDFKPSGAKLLWIVKDLRISERTLIGSEIAYLKYNVDAYISKEGKGYTLITSMDTVFAESSGGDVTAWHGEKIENAFKILLKQCLQKGKNTEVGAGYNIEEILNKEKEKINIPILRDSIYGEGVYFTFQDFLQNKPTPINYLPVVIGKNKIKFISVNEKNEMDTLQLWGLCKEGEIYKYHDETLIPIEKKANGFIISDYVEKAGRRNRNNFTGGLIGGIAEVLIESALQKKSSPVFLVTTIPYITKKQPEASSVDMRTGNLTF